MVLTTSPAGRAALARREGNKLTAYRDSVGVWTIGVGHTSAAGPPKVTQGLKITAAQSDEILSRDLATFEASVRRAIKRPMSQNQFDAMVSLAFNIGGGAFAKSSIVRRFNAGDAAGAAEAFLLYNKAGGKVLKGLVTRRQDEREQFLRPDRVAASPAKPKTVSPVPIAPVPQVQTVEPVVEPRSWLDRLLGIKPPVVQLVGRNRGDETLFRQQNRLLAAGYTEVGDPDGLWGMNTWNAVCLALTDQAPGVPLPDKPPAGWPLCDAVLAALAKLERRKVATDRATVGWWQLWQRGSTPIKAPTVVAGASGLAIVTKGLSDARDWLDSAQAQASGYLDTARSVFGALGVLGGLAWEFRTPLIYAVALAGLILGVRWAMANVLLTRQGTIRQTRL